MGAGAAAVAGRWVLVVNPRAGSGRGVEVAWRVEALCRAARIRFEVAHTARPGHAIEIARAAAGTGAAAVVVAVGGDGTLHEAVNGVADALHSAPPEPRGERSEPLDSKEVAAVGAIPVGTGNDFVKTLGIPPGVDAAFEVLRAGRRRRIDLGRFRSGTGAGTGWRWFMNQIQIGYGAEVVHDMRAPDALVRRILPGALAYRVAGGRRLATYSGREMAVLADGVERRGRFFEVHIANGRHCGGGISYAPRAEIDDGRLDLVIVDAMPLRRLVPVMIEVSRARLREQDGVAWARIRRVEVRDARGAAFPISADGEALEAAGGALETEVVPGAVEFVAPG